MMTMIQNEMLSHQAVIAKTIEGLQSHIYTACIIATQTLKNGNKILLCGNGGSAADAQHIAAELSGRYKTERRGLAGIALTTDTSVLTAVEMTLVLSVFLIDKSKHSHGGDLLIGFFNQWTR